LTGSRDILRLSNFTVGNEPEDAGYAPVTRDHYHDKEQPAQAQGIYAAINENRLTKITELRFYSASAAFARHVALCKSTAKTGTFNCNKNGCTEMD